tara:strand:- start:9814 stop:10665 length:852 start_codon:yes stop_codon:yes gene_type:complete
MVATITDSFVQQFSSNIHDLLEQKGSKLMGLVDMEKVVGDKAFFERIGSIDVAEVSSRHADTVLSDPAHSRRMLTIKDYTAAVMLDHQDKIKMLIEPTNNYAVKLSNGMGRKMDDIIIDALYGNAAAGADGSTTVGFDTSNQQIAAGGTGLTFEKLNQCKKIFLSNEYDGPLTIIMGADGLEDLLAESEIQSIDTNTVKALVRGEVDTFMGMKFIINNRIPDVGSDKNALVFAPEAVKLGVADQLKVNISERADKNHNMQVHVRSSFGAVRMEEELVVSILYT